MRNWTKTAVTGGLTALLVACGGGGGGGSSTPGVLSGNVIDGYIVGATVCLDLNSNTKCDAGEPSATTAASGAYSFSYSGNVTGLHVIAEVPVGATDEDLGPVTDPYSLFAPATSPSTVTPLTTLVSSEMMASGSSASDAESAVKTSLGISVDLLANNFKASGDTTVQDTAQKIVAAISEAKKAIDNGSTDLNAGDVIKQAVIQVKNDVLPSLMSSDGSITKSVAQIKIDASTNITGNLQNIVAKTKAGNGTVMSVKDAFLAGMVVVQKESGNYLAGESGLTQFTDKPVVEQMKISFEGETPVFSGTQQKALLESGWTNTVDTARHWLLVDGVWSRRIQQGAMTIADNCVKVQRTLLGIQEKYCMVRRDVSGKTLSSILPTLCTNAGSDCIDNAELPAGSYVYDLTVSAVDDQYDFYINETWGGYLTAAYSDTYNQDQTMTLDAFISYTADEEHRQFDGQNCNTAFWFTEYNDVSKTGKMNWKRNRSPSGCDNPDLTSEDGGVSDTETTNFSIKMIGEVPIMVFETSRLYRTGLGNSPRQMLKAFAYVPANAEDGRPVGGIFSGDVKLRKYSQRVEFNGDFRSSSQIMSKPVYKAIESALGLPPFPFSDEAVTPSMLRSRR